MIAIDTSAVIAILRGEDEAEPFALTIAEAEQCFFSAIGLLEASMVIIGHGSPETADRLDALVRDLAIEIVPLMGVHMKVQQQGFRADEINAAMQSMERDGWIEACLSG